MTKKRSFFERLTGSVPLPEEESEGLEEESSALAEENVEEEEAQLSVDVYQTPTDIVVETMVAGVKPQDLDIEVSRDMVTIRGRREEERTLSEDSYFTRELYWGAFSRTILLPEEIDPDQAEATEHHGLLVLKLPKIDKTRKASVKVKSI